MSYDHNTLLGILRKLLQISCSPIIAGKYISNIVSLGEEGSQIIDAIKDENIKKEIVNKKVEDILEFTKFLHGYESKKENKSSNNNENNNEKNEEKYFEVFQKVMELLRNLIETEIKNSKNKKISKCNLPEEIYNKLMFLTVFFFTVVFGATEHSSLECTNLLEFYILYYDQIFAFTSQL